MGTVEGWEAQAENWLAWARAPDHDADHLYREAFFELLPAPGWATLEQYARALEDAGLVIEALREPAIPIPEVERDPSQQRWRRLPSFLMIRAARGARPGRADRADRAARGAVDDGGR